MDKEQIRLIALLNGINETEQPSGEIDINTNIYLFANNLLKSIWIETVGGNLPDAGDHVLVSFLINGRRHFDIGQIMLDDGEPFWTAYCYGRWILADVTHWTQIPNLDRK